MKGMDTVQDLVEEAKVRTVYWALCVFAVCYFLSHTSNSMWMNIPISILMVAALRILSNMVEFRWRVLSDFSQPTYLSFLGNKQLSANDPRLSTSPPPRKWKRKIGSPVVEAAAIGFINKLLQDFVVDLWYSDITPDKEAPELILAIIMDALGEISGRVKELNLFDLLTRDAVNIVGDHLDLFRRNQLAIGRDVMSTLSTEQRDERLKHHLMDSGELHPALISSDCEYKFLQQLVGSMLSVVLRPREAQCPLVRCIARELVTSLVLQPVLNLACPAYINELVEYIILSVKYDRTNLAVGGYAGRHQNNGCTSAGETSSDDQGKHLKINKQIEKSLYRPSTSSSCVINESPCLPQPADWARMLDAATQRRTEVLMPENLENMWSRGKNYKHIGLEKTRINGNVPFREEMLRNKRRVCSREKDSVKRQIHSSEDLNGELIFEDTNILAANVNECSLKRSNSTSALRGQQNTDLTSSNEGVGPIISEFFSLNSSIHGDYSVKSTSDIVLHEAARPPSLKCRVKGAYFERIGSKSFAVYSIAVADTDSKTWFVKRRYRNFERLHRQLKEIPNYTLHLPPKRIFSSSTEDAFVHQRCIHLDKYLQDLLSIANVAEQHEVWDFLSISSMNYSFGKASSVMKTLAVNVDVAVDDIVRQFKEVSDGFKRKVVGSSLCEVSSIPDRNLSWHSDDISKNILMLNTLDAENTDFGKGGGDKVESLGLKECESQAQTKGWHSDNELSQKKISASIVKSHKDKVLDLENPNSIDIKPELFAPVGFRSERLSAFSNQLNDPVGVPPEWTPPNVSVPLLNLVDKIFLLQRRGWLRRQVFWISKQILQLVMEDAIDDFLLRQIYWLRRDDVIAQGIHWLQDVLWPDGKFFLSLAKTENNVDGSSPSQRPRRLSSNLGSFEAQLEASRRASYVKKTIFDGAPAALVSLIGYKQYKRCAKDIFFFLQSSICVKQLAYGMLELVLVSVFPELQEIIIDIHKKMRLHPQPV